MKVERTFEVRQDAALARLHEASSRLWHKRDLHDGLDEMLSGVIELLGADKGNIQLLDPARGVLEIVAQRGFGEEFLDFFREVSADDDSACGRALRSGQRIVIGDVEADAAYAPLRPIARVAGYRAVQSTPIIGRDGTPLGMLSSHFRSAHRPAQESLRVLDLYVRQAADFIERCRSDEALRESEARLRLAQQAARIGSFEWDLKTGVNTWTPELEAIYGLAPGEFGKTQIAWEQLVHPEDRAAAIGWVKEAIETGEPLEGEWRVVWPDGSVHWICGRFQLFKDAAGKAKRLTGVNIDITGWRQSEQASRESEARLSAIVGTAADAIVVIDEEGNIQSINPAAGRIFGYTQGEAVGNNVSMLMPEPHRSAHGGYLANYLSTGQANIIGIGREVLCRRKDGTAFPADLAVAEWHMSGKRFFTGILHDIGERKKREEQLKLLLREVNHRAKNLLAVVQAIANQTAKEDPGDFASTLRQRLSSLAASQDLLVANEWKGVDFASLLQTQLSHFEQLQAGRITFQGPPVRVSPAAAQTLGMALHELGTNAAKYGALSNNTGSVCVEWQLSGGKEPRFHLKWAEWGAPPRRAPHRRGFGTRILTEMAELELDAGVRLEYPFSGVIRELTAPAERILEGARSSEWS